MAICVFKEPSLGGLRSCEGCSLRVEELLHYMAVSQTKGTPIHIDPKIRGVGFWDLGFWVGIYL